MAKPIFDPFPGPPPFPRLPARWDGNSSHKWSKDLLRVLDQTGTPQINVVTGVSAAAAIQVTNANAIYICDTSGGGFTVTLPPATNMPPYTVTVKNRPGGAGNVTVDGNGYNIDGTATILIASPNSRTLVSDGTQWWII